MNTFIYSIFILCCIRLWARCYGFGNENSVCVLSSPYRRQVDKNYRWQGEAREAGTQKVKSNIGGTPEDFLEEVTPALNWVVDLDLK